MDVTVYGAAGVRGHNGFVDNRGMEGTGYVRRQAAGAGGAATATNTASTDLSNTAVAHGGPGGSYINYPLNSKEPKAGGSGEAGGAAYAWPPTPMRLPRATPSLSPLAAREEAAASAAIREVRCAKSGRARTFVGFRHRRDLRRPTSREGLGLHWRESGRRHGAQRSGVLRLRARRGGEARPPRRAQGAARHRRSPLARLARGRGAAPLADGVWRRDRAELLDG